MNPIRIIIALLTVMMFSCQRTSQESDFVTDKNTNTEGVEKANNRSIELIRKMLEKEIDFLSDFEKYLELIEKIKNQNDFTSKSYREEYINSVKSLGIPNIEDLKINNIIDWGLANKVNFLFLNNLVLNEYVKSLYLMRFNFNNIGFVPVYSKENNLLVMYFTAIDYCDNFLVLGNVVENGRGYIVEHPTDTLHFNTDYGGFEISMKGKKRVEGLVYMPCVSDPYGNPILIPIEYKK